jgi:quercetin dioxygenase-like cupin family protein
VQELWTMSSVSTRLNEQEVAATFHERGYVAPVPILGPGECKRILSRLRKQQSHAPLDWNKAWAATSADYYALATDDRIVELLTTLLGEDVILWGAALITRAPGQVHAWHTDIESAAPDGKTVSVWIGLSHTDVRSSLKVVPYSHRFGATIQQVFYGTNSRDSVTDVDVVTWARAKDERSGVVTLDTQDGEAVVFDGRLWHGSDNLRRFGTRFAVLLQYASSATAMRIPNLEHLAWPFELFDAPRPACILVSGRNVDGVNRTVPGPIVANGSFPALTTRIHQVPEPSQERSGTGWTRHFFFDGATANLPKMYSHVSVLDPGCQPHPLQHHPEEELVVVLDGEAELILEDSQEGEWPNPFAMQARGIAYYPSGFAHTIRNATTSPVTYLVFKWLGVRSSNSETPSATLVAASRVQSLESGVAVEPLLDLETGSLRCLHSHLSVLQPGSGYEPHADAYDVALVVLEGTLETLGERVTAKSIVFYAAGEPHGMRNVGNTLAVYLVFEFHARGTAERRYPNQLALSRRLYRRARRLIAAGVRLTPITRGGS